MNCPSCGGPNERNAKFCMHCGTALKVNLSPEQESLRHDDEKEEVYEEAGERQTHRPEQSGCGITLLSFFIPLAGLLLWLAWSKKNPEDARAARNGCFAAVIVWGVVIIFAVSMFFLSVGNSPAFH